MPPSAQSKVCFFLAVAAMSAPGCTFLPKPHILKERSAAEFCKQVAEQRPMSMEYCGSNAKCHFSHGRYIYQLGIPTKPPSIVKFYGVPREEIEITGEFKRTWDMK